MEKIKLLKSIVDSIEKSEFAGLTRVQAEMLSEEIKDHRFLLWHAASLIQRKHLLKRDLCASIYVDLRPCPEDCDFCPLSAHHYREELIAGDNKTGPENVSENIENFAKTVYENGLTHFKIVVTGLRVRGDVFEEIKEGVSRAKRKWPSIKICISGGILSKEQLKQLKMVGLDVYNNNLEASPKYFKKLVRSHTIEEKMKAIKDAISVGLKVCSGGLIGAGETMQDRIDMAFTLKELGVYSTPFNLLVQYPGLPVSEKIDYELSPLEILDTLAIFRLIMPEARIVLGAGRTDHLEKHFQEIALMIGASAFQASGYFSHDGIRVTVGEDSKTFEKVLNGKGTPLKV